MTAYELIYENSLYEKLLHIYQNIDFQYNLYKEIVYSNDVNKFDSFLNRKMRVLSDISLDFYEGFGL